MTRDPVLSISDLQVDFHTDAGDVHAVRGVNLEIAEGGVLGLVGESGCGKTVTMLAALGLLPRTATATGSVRFRGVELLGMPDRQLRRFRGARIAMIFQDPITSLNPVFTIGYQIAEVVRAHNRETGRDQAWGRAVDLLALMGIPEPARRARDYPHQLSGGMCQRAMIAMGLANDPDVLIADEPTTALDVTIQAQILDLLRAIRIERDVAIVLISHDLGVIAGLAEEVAVMYAGRVVERGPVDDVYDRPRHPYTRGLLAALPRLAAGARTQLRPIEGGPPSLQSVPSGCAFHPRCPHAESVCEEQDPPLRPVDDVFAACHFAERFDSIPRP